MYFSGILKNPSNRTCIDIAYFPETNNIDYERKEIKHLSMPLSY